MKKKTILVTGCGGYIGSSLIKQVQMEKLPVRLKAVSSSAGRLQERYGCCPDVEFVQRELLAGNAFPWDTVDVVVHLAFARRFCSDNEIADSIRYARTIFELAKSHKVPGVIYISSQGVYGNTAEMRTINTAIAPAGLYTMAKYAAEEVLKAVFDETDFTKYSIIRLDSVAGNQKMLPAFVEQAMTKGKIKVIGGTQVFSFMDVRDAASAILALAQLPVERWGRLYNVGWNEKRYSIVELAEIVKTVAKNYGARNVKIELERREIEQYAGMNSEQFSRDTGWKPQYDMHEIIAGLLEEYNERT